jgi:hypothetical protein
MTVVLGMTEKEYGNNGEFGDDGRGAGMIVGLRMMAEVMRAVKR